MKKTYLLGLTVLLAGGILSACKSANKEDKVIDFTTTEVGGFTRRGIGDSKDVETEFGDRFSANILKLNEVDYLRVTYPVKGEFKSLEYSVTIENYSTEVFKTDVKEVYKAYKNNGELTYANRTTGTKKKENSGDWYWACLDISFNEKNVYRDDKIKIVLTGLDMNNNSLKTDEQSWSFNDVKNRVTYYWGDGSGDREPTLPWSFQGGWQFQGEYINGNLEIESEWGFLYVDTDYGCEDFNFIGTVGNGSIYGFECYHGGKVYLTLDGDAMNVNIAEGCQDIKNAFSGCGDVITFWR